MILLGVVPGVLETCCSLTGPFPSPPTLTTLIVLGGLLGVPPVLTGVL